MNINEQRVREFAHQIWESEGCPDGQSHRHWEMACRLAEESEDRPAAFQQQQAAPQHRTVEHNDTDIINKPKQDKAKALKKTEAASKNKSAKFGMDSVNQNLTDRPGSTAMEGLMEPQSGPEKISFAKADSDKPARRKKAKLLKDVIETEVSPDNSGIQPV